MYERDESPLFVQQDEAGTSDEHSVISQEEIEIAEPPKKRRRRQPRQKQDQDDLVALFNRKAQNDRRLKSAFDSIFERYGQDFSGVGDEIDIETGRIVVNNGHVDGLRGTYNQGEWCMPSEKPVSKVTEKSASRRRSQQAKVKASDADRMLKRRSMHRPTDEIDKNKNGSRRHPMRTVPANPGPKQEVTVDEESADFDSLTPNTNDSHEPSEVQVLVEYPVTNASTAPGHTRAHKKLFSKNMRVPDSAGEDEAVNRDTEPSQAHGRDRFSAYERKLLVILNSRGYKYDQVSAVLPKRSAKQVQFWWLNSRRVNPLLVQSLEAFARAVVHGSRPASTGQTRETNVVSSESNKSGKAAREWTDEEDKRLLRMRRARVPWSELEMYFDRKLETELRARRKCLLRTRPDVVKSIDAPLVDADASDQRQTVQGFANILAQDFQTLQERPRETAWSQEEDQLLMALYQQNIPTSDMSAIFHSSEASVIGRYDQLKAGDAVSATLPDARAAPNRPGSQEPEPDRPVQEEHAAGHLKAVPHESGPVPRSRTSTKTEQLGRRRRKSDTGSTTPIMNPSAVEVEDHQRFRRTSPDTFDPPLSQGAKNTENSITVLATSESIGVTNDMLQDEQSSIDKTRSKSLMKEEESTTDGISGTGLPPVLQHINSGIDQIPQGHRKRRLDAFVQDSEHESSLSALPSSLEVKDTRESYRRRGQGKPVTDTMRPTSLSLQQSAIETRTAAPEAPDICSPSPDQGIAGPGEEAESEDDPLGFAWNSELELPRDAAEPSATPTASTYDEKMEVERSVTGQDEEETYSDLDQVKEGHGSESSQTPNEEGDREVSQEGQQDEANGLLENTRNDDSNDESEADDIAEPDDIHNAEIAMNNTSTRLSAVETPKPRRRRKRGMHFTLTKHRKSAGPQSNRRHAATSAQSSASALTTPSIRRQRNDVMDDRAPSTPTYLKPQSFKKNGRPRRGLFSSSLDSNIARQLLSSQVSRDQGSDDELMSESPQHLSPQRDQRKGRRSTAVL